MTKIFSTSEAPLARDHTNPVIAQEQCRGVFMHPDKRRIALYSHDAQGLGHLRRNLSIATALINADPDLAIMLITGAREISAFTLPPGIDCLNLPALGKNEHGQYLPRSLPVSLQHLVLLRSNILQATLTSFEPDVLIVDKHPLGIFEELKPSLEELKARGGTRFVLGLREVLDDPEIVHREWHLAGHDRITSTYYDRVWVYGDPQVYDPVREYNFSTEVAAKVRYTGYLSGCLVNDVSNIDDSDSSSSFELPADSLALCMVGGGQDGYQLAGTFLDSKLPAQTNGLVVTGPFMLAEAWQNLREQAANNPRQQVLRFVTNAEDLLRQADSVIAMGGYNTICEILSLKKRALIVPRVKPRREQLIRVKRLQALGLLDYLHPDNLESDALTDWLAHKTSLKLEPYAQINLKGLDHLPALLNEVLATSPQTSILQGDSKCTLTPRYGLATF